MSHTSPACGTLYLVATPLGNLQDLSPRAVATLGGVDLVAAEDTRRARQLLAHLGLHKPLESFHGDSDARKQARLARMLEAGQSVAYVSDGGTPGLADPGRELVQAAVACGARVVPIPGPCAAVTALSVSGMVADRFVFGGFPPRKSGERREFLEQLRRSGGTIVLYEAPHRLRETLQDVAAVLADPEVCVGRELTKQFEELLRGRASEVLADFATREPRGEFVLVIAARETEDTVSAPPEVLGGALRRLLDAGFSVRDAADLLADLGACGRREAYQLALAQKKEPSGPGEN